MLIEQLGGDSCLNTLKTKMKSQMFFSTKILYEDTLQTLRKTNPIQIWVKNESEEFSLL